MEISKEYKTLREYLEDIEENMAEEYRRDYLGTRTNYTLRKFVYIKEINKIVRGNYDGMYYWEVMKGSMFFS